ncbi:MAG: NAD-dependent epimerase/dehydratase family protein [Candidatus Margulisbacteria bacterium]|nr:NAD-dependent epimerase/dehydratase family protein [Candidatus Margulisiibacteriota bacterium]
MKIGLFGGTGFIGSALTEYLSKEGHEILIFTS